MFSSWRIATAVAPLLFQISSLPATAAGSQQLHGHVPSAVSSLQSVGSPTDTKELQLAIGLPLRNAQGLTNFLQQLYDPSSPNYRQFITPEQFAEKFGPASEDYDALAAFARDHNLKITALHPNRLILDVTAAVKDIEKAFNVKVRLYHHPTEDRDFYAPDTEPSLDLGIRVLRISGMDNYYIPRPKIRKGSTSTLGTVSPKLGSGPGGNYMGYDFRNAYVPGTPLTGTGQSVGLLEFDGYFASDVSQYLAQAGLPAVPLINVYIDGFNGIPGFGNSEVTLDIDMVNAMAPGLSSIIVYEAANGSPFVDILNRMATDNLAHQLSCSWGGGPPDATGEQIFLQMAAQGQSFFNAIGDSDAFTGPIEFPSESPNITQVGGTTLSTTGPLGSFISERVWNWGGGEGSSGGISTTYSIPVWQQGINMTTNGGSITFRNMPDVAMTADNIYIIADGGFQEPGTGGTSAAAPLWAGFLALVNQQAAGGGRPPVGFINPAVYAIGKGATYLTNFHDVVLGDNTSPASPNRFFAFPGYDLCTGWGSPNGTNLINTLAAPAPSVFIGVLTNLVSGGNGNGVIDPNECNNMTVVLENFGSAGATSVSATLASSTPGVIIAQLTSIYPDLPPGAIGTNIVPFKVSTAPGFVCGTPIDFTLVINCDQTTLTSQFRIATGSRGTPIRFDNNNQVAIPDGSLAGVSVPVFVTGLTSSVSKVTVSLHITHPFDGDLLLQLVSPDGVTNTLSASHGSSGQNYGSSCGPDSVRTTFDDETNQFIAAASAPFVGTFRPDQPLSVYSSKTGTNANGVWLLHVVDQLAGFAGTLDCWSLMIYPSACGDGGGVCPGVDLSIGMSAAPDPVFVGSNLVYAITVTNRGPSTAHGVAVSQSFSPGAIAFVSGIPLGSVVYSGGTVNASLGDIAAGATASAIVTIIPLTNGLLYSTASVGSTDTELNSADNTRTIFTLVNPNVCDLALGLLDSPDPVLVGGTLTYIVSVTNNGPSTAQGVVVTNVLPPSVTILGASSSQSNFTFAGNVVLWSLNNSLPLGNHAAATIQVRPNAEGTITATASASAAQPDPRQGNNTAVASTTVGPSADIGLGILQFPNPVVVGSNLTYVVSVTNFGPSTATGVTLNQSLPPSVTLLSSNTSQGTVTASAGSILGDLGSVASGAKATITLVVATSTNTTLLTTATASAIEADVNPANNSVSATAIVTNRILVIAPDGAKLTFESFCPANGTIEPGETVTNLFFLRNAGNVVNTNLVATLLPGGGVTAPSGPRSYGVLAPSGFSVGQPFSFTASGTNGGVVTATFSLKDGPNILSNVSFTFNLPQVATFSNTNAISIPDSGNADPYPSTITVSGISGLVGKVTATLADFTHTYPHDVSALLVSPGGAKTILMSHVADQSSVSDATLTFVSDCVAPVLPNVGAIGSGSWQPSAYAPAVTNSPFDGTTYASMSIFSGVDPGLINGDWSLYVLDDAAGDSGSIAGGWSLAITTISPVSQLPDLGLTVSAVPGPLHAGDPLLYSFAITNAGPGSASGVGFTNVLPASLNLISVTSSQGSVTTNGGIIIANLGSIGVGANATLSILTQPNAAGLITNTATLFGREADPHPANNTASAVTSVLLPVADVGITLSAATNSLVFANPISYVVTVTNGGPENAVNIVVTDSLPKGLGSGSTSLSPGYWSNQGGLITCNLGTLLPYTATSFTITATATNSGFITNIVTVATTSSTDTNSANNSASAVISVAAISPNIIAAGAILNSENLNQNGAIDPGETVNVSFALANIGSQDTVNVLAAINPYTSGVTNTGGTVQYYGPLIHGGPSVSRPFGFTALNPVPGGALQVVLSVYDQRPGGTVYLADVPFTFNMAATNIFANTNAITIPDHGPGSPYPSIITVSNLPGIVSKVTATISGLSHSFARDVNVLLVNPAGGSVKLMSHTSGAHAVTNANLTFDDSAAQFLPSAGQIYDGTYYPTSYLGSVTFNSPAPSGNYGTAMNALNSVSPNGQWSLYVLDDAVGDAGNIAHGWSLKISTLSPLNPVSDRLSIVRTGVTNQSLLTLSGLSVHGYQLLVSTNLTSWTPVMTGTTAPNGTISVTITNALKHQYYRSLRL
jgi:uncharacterized repeat protein (TIGR01451 family)